MNVVDSSGWIEYLAGGPNADFFREPIEDDDALLVPALSLFEVYRHLLRHLGREDALNVVAAMRRGTVIDLDDRLAFDAVESEDLDLLVISRNGAEPEWRAPVEVDLRTYAPPEVGAELEAGGDLLPWAVKFGVPLFDRDSAWERIVQVWQHSLRLPDPEVAEKRAQVAYNQLQALEEMGDEVAANEVRVSYLTHLARASLARAQTFPASRPELPDQLRTIGEGALANLLAEALVERKRLASESAAV